jgi:thiamine biosynthesis lipoprotein
MQARTFISLAIVLCFAARDSDGKSAKTDEKPDSAALSRFTFTEPHMGTRFRIVLYAANEQTARDAARAAFDRIAALDNCMSDYKPESELMRLCAKAGGDPIPVSPELFTVLQKAQDVAAKSDGAFDVTVGPVVRLWRVSRRNHKLPDGEKLAKARDLVGYRNVQLDAKARTVRLLKAGMQLDLGGIAKGYSADEALVVLQKKGIQSALVAAGGDIAVGAAPPGKEGWDVAIIPLQSGDASPHLLLHDAAVSTSGDAEQFVEIDGVRYSHIVDPRTGIGLIGRSQVTVVARRGIDSDSLTKVIAVLGPERGMPIVEEAGATARVLRLTDRGKEMSASKNFPKTVYKPAQEKDH